MSAVMDLHRLSLRHLRLVARTVEGAIRATEVDKVTVMATRRNLLVRSPA